MARVITLVLFVALGLAFLSRSCIFGRSGGAVVLVNGRIVSANGAREIDVNGLYIAAMTFDRSAPTLIDGIRHVWVGQLGVGDPGNVVIMRNNPGRVRPGYVPDTNSIVGAVVDGVYYTARDLSRSPRTR